MSGQTDIDLLTAWPASLAREIDRARGTGQPLVLALVGIRPADARGDRLLAEVAGSLRSELRSYDLVLRYASAELICVLPALDLTDAARRFGRVAAALAPENGSVTVGLAQLAPGDSAADLIARAGAARRPGDAG